MQCFGSGGSGTIATTTSTSTVKTTTTARPAHERIASPRITKNIYVDAINGDDENDGRNETAAFKTMQRANTDIQDGTKVLVKNGVYINGGFGSGRSNGPVLRISNKSDVLLTNFPGHTPVIEFDGAGGIVMSRVKRVEISRFDIFGPNSFLTKEEALNDRTLKRDDANSNLFLGRGIVAWSGNNIYIHHNKVHHCPGSGIRCNKGDYVAIEDNIVFNNTWWTSSAESAIVIADARSIDELDLKKFFLNHNEVFGNQNFIPFYSKKVACTRGCPGRPGYGSFTQTYIIDGSGVYVTRNKNYRYGRFDMSYNRAYLNGINGLVVHKTDRAHVVGNIIWNNGQVSRGPPEMRQPYAGLTLNQADKVEVRDNMVKTETRADFSYVMHSSGGLNSGSGNNRNCKISAADGSSKGRVSEQYGSTVKSATWVECSAVMDI